MAPLVLARSRAFSPRWLLYPAPAPGFSWLLMARDRNASVSLQILISHDLSAQPEKPVIPRDLK